MNKFNPNQEVEEWKDAYYNKFKNIDKINLSNYLEKEADHILKENHIKCSATKIIKESELASA